MQKNMPTLCSIILVLLLTACGMSSEKAPVPSPTIPEKADSQALEDDESKQSATKNSDNDSIQIAIGDKIFSATLEKNDAAIFFARLLEADPIVLQMSDYSGFEKVGFLKTSLPENDHHITTQAGDIVLYNKNQIVVFYGSNSWSYTMLGKIDDLSGWKEALSSGNVTLTFSKG